MVATKLGDLECGCGELEFGSLGFCQVASAEDEQFPTTVVERLALRALARRSASSAGAPAAAASSSWQLRINEPDSDEDGNEDEGDEYGFVLPRGWETQRMNGNRFSWTDGIRTVHSITDTWEVFAAIGRQSSSELTAPGPRRERPVAEPEESCEICVDPLTDSDDDPLGDFVSVEALLDALQLEDDEAAQRAADAVAPADAPDSRDPKPSLASSVPLTVDHARQPTNQAEQAKKARHATLPRQGECMASATGLSSEHGRSMIVAGLDKGDELLVRFGQEGAESDRSTHPQVEEPRADVHAGAELQALLDDSSLHEDVQALLLDTELQEQLLAILEPMLEPMEAAAGSAAEEAGHEVDLKDLDD